MNANKITIPVPCGIKTEEIVSHQQKQPRYSQFFPPLQEQQRYIGRCKSKRFRRSGIQFVLTRWLGTHR